MLTARRKVQYVTLVPAGLGEVMLAGIWIFRHGAWSWRIGGFALLVLSDDLTRLGRGQDRGLGEVKVTEGGRRAGMLGGVQHQFADRPFGRKIPNV
jgi:hypothetical protein